jgi:hypothetical protein
MSHKIKTQIIIDAPINKVWEALIDFYSYPNWNSFITSIEGEAIKGNRIEVTIQVPDYRTLKIKPTVIECTPNVELRWVGHMWFTGLFDGEHKFKLEALNEGSTHLIHSEKFSGMLAPLVLKVLGNGIEKGFNQMNKELKMIVEQNFLNQAVQF